MIYGIAYFAIAALLARYFIPRMSESRDDAEWGGMLMLAWPLALPVALFLMLGARGWERR